MKIAFLITSTLEVDNTHNFVYQPHLKRSCWSTDERIEQTYTTINQIKNIMPYADIFLLDSSRNYNSFSKLFKNINFIPVYQLNPDLIETTHISKIKGLCETLILDTFINHYTHILKKYDFVIKITGRYFINETFDSNLLNVQNLDKILVKGISWVSIEKFKNTGYEQFVNIENRFPYVLTSLYAVGKNKLEVYKNALNSIIDMYNTKNINDVALETVFYHALSLEDREYTIIPWEILGKCGVTGQIVHY